MFKAAFIIVIAFWSSLSTALREFRSYSTRGICEMAQDPNYPFAYSKYLGQASENKGRVNSNLQDFRHTCYVLGGTSKCHICDEFKCGVDKSKTCYLQLQGVNTANMSINVPTVSDTAWAVNGSHRHDYGGKDVTHYCVFTTGGDCIQPTTSDFSNCSVRCFGHGFHRKAIKSEAQNRTLPDVYPDMGRWIDDGQVDLWQYPSNCDEMNKVPNSCTKHGTFHQIPSYNPQGYTFTVAGSGKQGFMDGHGTAALFNQPQDLALDENDNVYVADTNNHAIRKITPDGIVSTIAGRGDKHKGSIDGKCNVATFAFPKGIDVRHEKDGTLVILVADTGNHRIRRIDMKGTSCVVRCLTGLCGNNTLSATDSVTKANPLTGYADGTGLEARFSAPESVAFLEGNVFAIADTGNFLIRLAYVGNGTTFTLAGSVVHGEMDPNGAPLAGCTPPCLVGQAGFRDGNLTYAQFYNPLDVTRGPNNTIWVADEQRIRIVELPQVLSHIYSITSRGRVSTIAGTSLQGHDDDIADKSTFFYSSGVFVTKDNIAYVADAMSCHIRRITPIPLVAEQLTCETKANELVRPSGCTSFDQPIDAVGRKISRVEANIQYNYGDPYLGKIDQGKYIKNCVGVPPRDTLDKHFIVTGDNLVVDDLREHINEDSEQGMAIIVHCPPKCKTSLSLLEGTHWYSEESSICKAALHDGVLKNSGGIIQITLERRDFLNTSTLQRFTHGSVQHNITSKAMNLSDSYRVFKMIPFNVSNSVVHTVAGKPSAPLQSGCGFADGQPSMNAVFNNPSGIAARYGSYLNDSTYLYVADTANNRIRAISATCTQICENGGRCVGADTCKCLPGWVGVDCTKPICTIAIPLNHVCVAPNLLACKPGYSGANCNIATCSQHCQNGGTCAFPDTCQCKPGWFDTNCTTPVCSQTCANGGNCIAPNVCDCPSEWYGPDCRTPKCSQTCHNNGTCVAPNTCACSPQWSNFDCTSPVCSQGFFQANTHSAYPTYKNCDIQSWCHATNEFECDQTQMTYEVIGVPFGDEFYNITGRRVAPTQCMNIELPISFKVPFQLLNADNSTTGDVRYSPISRYESNPRNAWRGYLNFTGGHTGPWTYKADRQVAYVNWLNVSQGVYVCANGGSCVAPNQCACAEGWIGFDCRTPVCDSGYYHKDQEEYVSGQHSADEIELFDRFMFDISDLNTPRQQWNYSNPDYSTEIEYYESTDKVVRKMTYTNGSRYLLIDGKQGGYRCSIRANTQWENENYIYSHPNFYSLYMDETTQADHNNYTSWIGMRWPPTHQKSRILDKYFFNQSYAFTNEGYRRRGIWSATGQKWQYGICVIEFERNCTSDRSKQYDIRSKAHNVLVQDTDVSYRPVIFYNDSVVISTGRWKEAGGSCVDEVVRGCANNGTCYAPNKCRCATGWSGSDCKTPVCSQTCHHNGKCTAPNTCTCEKGWMGSDCLIPMCAQECQNGGVCVAPDTCQCKQWPNSFRDGRIAGGRPLFQDANGDPLSSGWTGYDCSVPICVQAETFVLNVLNTETVVPGTNTTSSSAGFVSMGGHGSDGTLACTEDGKTLPRCPNYDVFLTGNDGKSFQTGCGWDPFDTGCCINVVDSIGTPKLRCYICAPDVLHVTNDTFYCTSEDLPAPKPDSAAEEFEKLTEFTDKYKNYQMCGSYHAPRDHDPDKELPDYGVDSYYVNVLDNTKNSFNYLSNWTSNRFLCNVLGWYQGDYIDDAGLGSIVGAGSIYGLSAGRHVRINYPVIISDGTSLKKGAGVPGEGLYKCYNSGSCIGPDYCTCTDGYEGDDCNTPLCRHLQPSGAVSSCLNGGICVSKDSCNCVQSTSVLWNVHPEAARGLTGWTGTDCSMPMCAQGYFDPFCTDLPQAPGGEGCFRCANKGNCTAPDVCTCAPGWTGYDCRTPVCEVVADPLTRTQLGSVFEDKIIGFESDPCGVEPIYGRHGWHGTKYSRGNCTQPNQCTCLCKVPYRLKACHKKGQNCNGPWQDPMVQVRNLLVARGPEYTFGSTDCEYGYEGNVDSTDRFTTCHQTIYVPTTAEKTSIGLIVGFSVAAFVVFFFYRFASVRLKKRFLLAKIERRRSKRSSEESMLSGGNSGSFTKAGK